MGDTERPIPERDGDQEAQAALLVQTGNGPTVDNEQTLLAEQFGPADMAGYYSTSDPTGRDDNEPAEDDVDGEPADQDDTAEGGSEGGESA